VPGATASVAKDLQARRRSWGPAPCLSTRATAEARATRGSSTASSYRSRRQARTGGAAWRDPFRNAQDVYSFTSTHMPKQHAGEIKQGDYWALVNFLLAHRGDPASGRHRPCQRELDSDSQALMATQVG